MREIVNAIFYVLRGGITWRLLPSDFPPWQTVYRWFAAFRDGSVFEKLNHGLVMADGTVGNSVCGRAIEHYAAIALMKRSPKITANWALAMDHSRGGIFHSFSDRFKIR